MMIAGFIITAGTAGHYLDPFSLDRLVIVCSVVSALAVIVTILAVAGIEGGGICTTFRARGSHRAFLQAGACRSLVRATLPVVRDLHFRVDDRLLGTGPHPRAVRRGRLCLYARCLDEACRRPAWRRAGRHDPCRRRHGPDRRADDRLDPFWTIGGCAASAVALVALACAASSGRRFPSARRFFCLGLANGAFAIAAIGAMMQWSRKVTNRARRAHGSVGAAQGIAFGIGGFLGTLAADVARAVLASPVTAYASVFLAEALLFVVSAILALKVARLSATVRARPESLLMARLSAPPSRLPPTQGDDHDSHARQRHLRRCGGRWRSVRSHSCA